MAIEAITEEDPVPLRFGSRLGPPHSSRCWDQRTSRLEGVERIWGSSDNPSLPGLNGLAARSIPGAMSRRCKPNRRCQRTGLARR